MTDTNSTDLRLLVTMRAASEFHPERVTITDYRAEPGSGWAVVVTGPSRTRPASLRWSGNGTGDVWDARLFSRAVRLAAVYLPNLSGPVTE